MKNPFKLAFCGRSGSGKVGIREKLLEKYGDR
jgi:hypothetical protein